MIRWRYLIRVLLLIVLLTFVRTPLLQAQITIGSDEAPVAGALLQLKGNEDLNANATKGLVLPRVSLLSLKPTDTDLKSTISGTDGDAWSTTKHIGLVVYNINKIETKANRICPGIHVWDGEQWTPFVAYPPIKEERTIQSLTNRNFEYLDSTSPASAWPSGKSVENYPLGPLGTFTDNRTNDTPQNYTYARFYVGYKTRDAIYSVKRSYSCDAASTVWVNEDPENEIVRTFQDGVWMTDHLKAITMPDGTAIALNNSSASDVTTVPYYNYPNLDAANRSVYGVLYNWPAAVNLGSSAGQTVDPLGVDQGGSATSADVDVQGICPTGWHMPCDQDWTDLSNGIILKTSTFSSTADIGTSGKVTYDKRYYFGEPLGKAMQTTTKVNGTSTIGTSKPANQGGFDSYLVGYVATAVSGYGAGAYMWSSSNANSTQAWFRGLINIPSIYRLEHDRERFYSVRCIKN